VVDILASIQKRPEQERADAEILDNLRSLVGNRREALAIGRVRESIQF
jgi:hypothetical protein